MNVRAEGRGGRVGHPGWRVGGRAAVALGFSLLLVACGPAGGSPPPSVTAPVATGIRGQVLLGPTCPVEQEDQPPCVTPYAATLVVTDRDGTEVARSMSGADGRFEIVLPPGDYTILPQTGDNGFPFTRPVDVTVPPGGFTEVEINYDSGIR